MSSASDFKAAALERFLRYVRIDTQSDPDSDSFPSTAKQLDLLRPLADELRGLGVADVELDDFGYVMGKLPATLPPERAAHIPVIGLLAHVDTSPDVSGEGVQPQVIESYNGGTITLPGAPELKLDPEQVPALAKAAGHTLVTSDGTTLLGADDKAGVAEIMTAVAHLMSHPEIEHGPIAVAFSPDEEVGRGMDHFDLERFGARYAYTLDGSLPGSIQFETFSADEAVVTILGRSHHPGWAKGKMVNAVKLAAEFVRRLPSDRLCPEQTEGRDGFVHPHRIEGSVEKAVVRLLLRDFDNGKLSEQRRFIDDLAKDVCRSDARASVKVEFSERYRNMKQAIDQVPFVVDYAAAAVRRVGLEPFFEPVRGGTDGSRLTAKGLPTPNLFTGGENYHSRTEWADVDVMAKAVETIVALVQIWAERGDPRARPQP